MIKKILPAILFLGIILSANAQIKKGAYLLGGNIGFSSSTIKNENRPDFSKNSGINISPAFGVAIKENIIAGFDVTYGYGSSRPDNLSEQESDFYGAGIFVRKYKELGKGFYLFGQGRLGAAYNKQAYQNSASPASGYVSEGYNVRTAFYPGISYAISNKLQIETGFNDLIYFDFSHEKRTGSTSSANLNSKTNAFSVGTNLSSFSGFVTGFRFLLNK